MKDIILAKSHLLENDLNFVLVRGEDILDQSSGRGIKPIYHAYKEGKENFKAASVADRVIGKAASMFLIAGGIESLYTDLISDIAYDMLINHGIEVQYSKKVPMILNRSGDDICPMEKLSSDVEDVDGLIENIEEFFRNIK